MNRGFSVRGLGEIAIRCHDLAAMSDFYGGILGLEPLDGGYRKGIRFFRIADGVAGHTQVLALFESGFGEDVAHGTGSSLHHLAQSLPHEEQSAVMDWYGAHDIAFRVEEFPWIGRRGILATDPEGNTVELVAFDPALAPPG